MQISALLVMAAASCWGVIGIFTRGLGGFGLGSIQVTAVRCALTAVFMFVYLLIKDKSRLKINPKDIWMFFGTGLISVVFFNICYFFTIQNASLSFASILLYTAPFFVMIISLFVFNEKMTVRKVLALIVAFTGCIFVTGILRQGGGAISAKGILFGIGSGLGYALYSVFGRIALEKYSSETVTAYTFYTAAICLLPFLNLSEFIIKTKENSMVLVLSVLLCIVSTIIPYLLYTKGLENLEAGKASIIAFVEPVVASLVGFFIFNEKISASNFFGMLLIFLAIIILNVNLKTTEQ